MAKKMNPQPPAVTKLMKPRELFKNELIERISIGEELANRSINSEQDNIALYKDYSDWHDYNSELVKRAFNKPDSEYYNEYSDINRNIGFYDSMRRDIN